jgi:hypothetical protein
MLASSQFREDAEMAEDKVRENRLRRMAERQGYRLMKSPRRDPYARDYNKYALVNPALPVNHPRFALQGAKPFMFSATLDDVEVYLTSDRRDEAAFAERERRAEARLQRGSKRRK